MKEYYVSMKTDQFVRLTIKAKNKEEAREKALDFDYVNLEQDEQNCDFTDLDWKVIDVIEKD